MSTTTKQQAADALAKAVRDASNEDDGCLYIHGHYDGKIQLALAAYEAAVAADAEITVKELTQWLWDQSKRTDITEEEEQDLDDLRDAIDFQIDRMTGAKAALRQQKETKSC